MLEGRRLTPEHGNAISSLCDADVSVELTKCLTRIVVRSFREDL